MTRAAEHFGQTMDEQAKGAPTASGRFAMLDDLTPEEIIDGLVFRPVMGESMLLNVVSYEKNTVVPLHSHVEEQIVVVLDGEFEFEIDGTSRTMRRGDVAVVPPWVRHGARTFDTECVEADIFSPPRETLLDSAYRPDGA